MLKHNSSNDYGIDRATQKTETYSGIKGVNTQDYALQEGMGPIVDRSKEFLGTTDKAIVAMRRLLLEAIKDVEVGKRPKGADPKTHRGMRPHDRIIAENLDWRVELKDELVAKW